MTPDFRSREATVARLRHLFAPVAEALDAGIAVQRAIHVAYNWSSAADEHLVSHLVRREALEHLRPYTPHVRPDEGFGLPMSGLAIVMPTDCLRIWRSRDGELPLSPSEPKKEYLRQVPWRQLVIEYPGARDSGGNSESERPKGTPAATCNTVILWDTDGSRLTRFELVCTEADPQDADKSLIAWRIDLLAATERLDLDGYGKRADDDGASGEMGSADA